MKKKTVPIIHNPPETKAGEIVRTLLELRYGYPVEFRTTRLTDETPATEDPGKHRVLRFSITYDFKTEKLVTTASTPFRVNGSFHLEYQYRTRKWVLADGHARSFIDNNLLVKYVHYKMEPSKHPTDQYGIQAFAKPDYHGCGSGLHDRKVENLNAD